MTTDSVILVKYVFTAAFKEFSGKQNGAESCYGDGLPLGQNTTTAAAITTITTVVAPSSLLVVIATATTTTIITASTTT